MGLDWRAILAGVAPVAWYVAMAVLATLGGYPGVICVTPMAWLIGLAAGQRVAALTSSPPGRGPLVEAAIAGALVGVVESVVFVVIGAQAPLSGADELGQMLAFGTCLVGLGIVVPAVLAVAVAWVVGRRRLREEGE